MWSHLSSRGWVVLEFESLESESVEGEESDIRRCLLMSLEPSKPGRHGVESFRSMTLQLFQDASDGMYVHAIIDSHRNGRKPSKMQQGIEELSQVEGLLGWTRFLRSNRSSKMAYWP